MRVLTTLARDWGPLTIRKVEITMAALDPFRSDCLSGGIRSLMLECAKTGPSTPAVGAMRIQPCLNVWLEVMLLRDLSGDTGGKRPIYRRISDGSEGRRHSAGASYTKKRALNICSSRTANCCRARLARQRTLLPSLQVHLISRPDLPKAHSLTPFHAHTPRCSRGSSPQCSRGRSG